MEVWRRGSKRHEFTISPSGSPVTLAVVDPCILPPSGYGWRFEDRSRCLVREEFGAAQDGRGGSARADAARTGAGREPSPLPDTNPCSLPPLQRGCSLRPRRRGHRCLSRGSTQKAPPVNPRSTSSNQNKWALRRDLALQPPYFTAKNQESVTRSRRFKEGETILIHLLL